MSCDCTEVWDYKYHHIVCVKISLFTWKWKKSFHKTYVLSDVNAILHFKWIFTPKIIISKIFSKAFYNNKNAYSIFIYLISRWGCGKNHSSSRFVVTTFVTLQLFWKAPSVATPCSCYTLQVAFYSGICSPFSRVVGDVLPWDWTLTTQNGLSQGYFWSTCDDPFPLSQQACYIQATHPFWAPQWFVINYYSSRILKDNCKNPFQNKTCYSEDFRSSSV